MSEVQGKPLERKQAAHAIEPGPLFWGHDPRQARTYNSAHPGNARRPWQRPLPRGVGGVQRHFGRRFRLRLLRHVVPSNNPVREPFTVQSEHFCGPFYLQGVPGHHSVEVGGQNGPFRPGQPVRVRKRGRMCGNPLDREHGVLLSGAEPRGTFRVLLRDFPVRVAPIHVLPQVAGNPDEDPVERGKAAGENGQGEQRGTLSVSIAPPGGCFFERGGEY